MNISICSFPSCLWHPCACTLRLALAGARPRSTDGRAGSGRGDTPGQGRELCRSLPLSDRLLRESPPLPSGPARCPPPPPGPPSAPSPAALSPRRRGAGTGGDRDTGKDRDSSLRAGGREGWRGSAPLWGSRGGQEGGMQGDSSPQTGREGGRVGGGQLPSRRGGGRDGGAQPPSGWVGAPRPLGPGGLRPVTSPGRG